MFTVLDSATVFLEAKIPEANLKRLASTQGATYELAEEAGRFIPITGAAGGRLVFLGLQVDAATRTVPLVHEVKNADARLRVGQALDLHVETARTEDALAIPDSAIVDEDGKPIAFVQVSGETFQKRGLKLGIKDGNWVQVLSGLAEGERVVTKGAYAVAVKIFGENLYQLRLLAEQARQAMQAVPGVVDLSVEQQMDVPILKVRFDRHAIARHGLSIRDVAQTALYLRLGRPVTVD